MTTLAIFQILTAILVSATMIGVTLGLLVRALGRD